MDIDWAALGQVFGVSVAVTVATVGLFTLGILGTSRRTRPAEAGAEAVVTGPSAGARAGALVSFALCGAAVAYGIWIIVAG
ncbi:hypothetical protein SRB5_24250 [Streptomyces sp. RB5]|uniref:Uncharacterized protein n=1 Tax=Streptomyces smaragdinus TaxID=2585196 RepID=A0A7K0CH01_9ACTN|nr:hypothetical protein [Streptomyces smaragdinus]MQY12292.1 hypothetical protein [Streptomyces smaragdinus]